MAFDFLTNFVSYTDPVKSPRLLRLWAGIGVLSAIVSRRIWLQANSRLPPLYPNVYIMQLADPGIGKDLAINLAELLCYEANLRAQKQLSMEIFHSGGESISPKGLIDKLKESKQMFNYTVGDKTETIEFHSLAFFIGEATTAMPEYDKLLIGFLNDLYNCKPAFHESIRGIEFTIKNPHVMMLMGTQPSTLFNVFPEATFSMGFTARMFIVYCDEPVTDVKTWLEPEEDAKLDQTTWDKLIKHLLKIAQWAGPLKTTECFRREITTFEETNPAPVPGNRFKHWNTRRSFNLGKLSLLMAASQGDQLVTSAHFNRALEYLFDIEKRMPYCFQEVTSDRGFSEVLEGLRGMLNGSEEITQYKLLTHLSKTRQPHEVRTIIEQAVHAGILIPICTKDKVTVKPLRYKVRDAKKVH